MANMIGGAFSAFPVTGSFSRSAVNSDSGAKLRTAGLVTAALVGLTLTCLTPVFAHLPLFALAAIVISGVLGLVDYPEAIRHLYQTNRLDFAVWLTACFGTLLAGVEIGLAIAIAASLLIISIVQIGVPGNRRFGSTPWNALLPRCAAVSGGRSVRRPSDVHRCTLSTLPTCASKFVTYWENRRSSTALRVLNLSNWNGPPSRTLTPPQCISSMP